MGFIATVGGFVLWFSGQTLAIIIGSMVVLVSSKMMYDVIKGKEAIK